MTAILLMQPRTPASGPGRQPARALPLCQRGVVLFIALIVLVAMTMAGIAIMRSVDTGNLISGNFAFKQGTLQAADFGANAAIAYLVANEFTGQLDNNNPAAGYTAVGTEPGDWAVDVSWANSVTAGTDATGNKVEYVINRLCEKNNTPPNQNNCAKIQNTGGQAGNSQTEIGCGTCIPQPKVFYRLTTRVTGPRGSTSIVQFDVALQH